MHGDSFSESEKSWQSDDFQVPRFQVGGKVVSPKHRPPLRHWKYSWYSFLLEAGLTPGSNCGQKDYVNENSNDIIWNRNRDLSACSAVSQPTAPLRALFQ